MNQRIHELGIRMALGARPGDVLRLILRQGLMLTLIGIVTGLAGASAATRLMADLLFATSVYDPLTWIVVPLILLAVTLLACWVPARRATLVDPLVALREE